MKRCLFIHIGWHKTATSCIQLYLDRYRSELAESGICYPVIHADPAYHEVKHVRLYLSMLNALKIDHLQRGLAVGDFDTLFGLSVRRITDSGCRYAIISEEGLSRPIRGMAALLGRYREFFDEVRIVAWLRRQDYFFESFYAQFVKQKPERTPLPFREYLRNSDLELRADYALILGWWAEEFGSENIIVAPFEQAHITPDPVTFFFRLLGLPVLPERFCPEKTVVHASPPREVTEYFRYMNMHDTDFFVPVLTNFLKECGSVATGSKFLCRADRERILRQYEDSNREVAREYLNRVDGVLFREPVREFADCRETWNGMVPDEVLAYALPVSGRMSHEIARLRHENRLLHRENQKLRNNESRISRWWKKMCGFLA